VTPSVFGVAQEGHAVRHETRLVTVRTRWLTIDEGDYGRQRRALLGCSN
jgi:hypothetical protein